MAPGRLLSLGLLQPNLGKLMDSAPSIVHSCRNLLLSRLPPEELDVVWPMLEHVPTPFGMLLYERNKPLQYAYFPCSGQHSILAQMQDGSAVEVGTTGREGMSSVDLVIGGEMATETTVCQVPGDALRMKTAHFRRVLAELPVFRDLIQRYMQAYLALVSQSVACNRLHNLNQRFARWVLIVHDRADGNDVALTQEYLAIMLGAQRPSVSAVASAFQQENVIRYSRGVITILDRPALERTSCECYATVRQHFRRLLGVDG
ncbi:MAG: Crp/Fnr family transcriptional regulator [Paucimonas sp.]|jgi:CRP-like cAMP-binding protein|nr:Crp/Fnr family transcriptional regulator [Paucimonas sp.]